MSDNKKTKPSAASSKKNKQSHSDADVGTAIAETGEQVQEQVVDLTHQIRQQANEQIDTQKERLADTLKTAALLLHQAGEHADLKDKAVLSGYVDKAAGQVSQWSESLRERDASQLMDATMQYARRQPMAFLGATLAVGFAGARFLQSSAQKAENWPEETTGNGSEDNRSESGDVDSMSDDTEQAYPDSDLTTGIAIAEVDVLSVIDDELDYLEVVEFDTTAGLEGDLLEGDPLIDDSMAGDIDPTSMGQR